MLPKVPFHFGRRISDLSEVIVVMGYLSIIAVLALTGAGLIIYIFVSMKLLQTVAVLIGAALIGFAILMLKKGPGRA